MDFSKFNPQIYGDNVPTYDCDQVIYYRKKTLKGTFKISSRSGRPIVFVVLSRYTYQLKLRKFLIKLEGIYFISTDIKKKIDQITKKLCKILKNLSLYNTHLLQSVFF